MAKSNKMKTRLILIAAIAVILISVLLYLTERYGAWKVDNCGIPDAVSSVCRGEKCCLTVVANSGQIADKEAFAREVVQMCRENSFRSLRLSTDIGGWPVEMEIDVYLRRKDVGEAPPVFRIRAESDFGGRPGDMENQPVCYRIFIE